MYLYHIFESREKESAFSASGHNAFFYDKGNNFKISFHIQTDEYHPSADRKAAIMDCKFEDGTINVF